MLCSLQPDGSWGWSNAGLVADGDQTLLVDTLFDLPLTADMLNRMRDAVPAAGNIRKLINTHANGDHTFGNQLVQGAEIIACRACAEKYAEAPPEAFAARAAAWQLAGEGGAFFHEIMGSRFDWRGLVNTPPTTLFDQTMEVTVGNKRLVLTHLGSAHTRGDVLVHVPDDRILYAGDLLFVGGHPVIWSGPVGNWIKACDYILGLDVDIIVPGHGPIAEKPAVRELKAYFEYIATEAAGISTTMCPTKSRRENKSRPLYLLARSGAHGHQRRGLISGVLGIERAARPHDDVRRDEAIPGRMHARSCQSRVDRSGSFC